ncbi:23S rRNA pseudouridine(2605) synthase RluB [Beggiatoa leptomitoformis]|uniref:Pseudouridine synthase n=1 Tax=Beggiatoa leptomitoformis TaxID=288004 RepID=A0A2N9YA70_9GAMM|nr:pseudouridine synthase [Beggiatoa leptomitoformis]AUI67334.1 pseudouridine synthase [Beggiatoa leptomitoformis]QGX03577.1 pseudouridine synthase [Beggiatoa leptomitoformis]
MRFNPETTEKLQKVLARAGLGSRRAIETWIQEGRIKVNQQVAHVGARVSAQDEIQLDGRKLSVRQLLPPPRQILIYNKPIGEVCSRDDEENRPLIFDKLPKPKQGRWVSVGRLDVNTTGLLLLTTDGELANRLMHPSTEIEREYAVRVLGKVDDAMIQRLTTGVQLEEGMAHFESVVDAGGEGANHWYHVILKEGIKREVRRLWEAQGVVVSRLMRIRYGVVTLPPSLRMGQSMELEGRVRQLLLQQVDLAEEAHEVIPDTKKNRALPTLTIKPHAPAKSPVRRAKPRPDWWDEPIDSDSTTPKRRFAKAGDKTEFVQTARPRRADASDGAVKTSRPHTAKFSQQPSQSSASTQTARPRRADASDGAVKTSRPHTTKFSQQPSQSSASTQTARPRRADASDGAVKTSRPHTTKFSQQPSQSSASTQTARPRRADASDGAVKTSKPHTTKFSQQPSQSSASTQTARPRRADASDGAVKTSRPHTTKFSQQPSQSPASRGRTAPMGNKTVKSASSFKKRAPTKKR